MSDNWDITTGDGGVTLYLPSGFNADLDAHTGDGSHPQRSRRGRTGPKPKTRTTKHAARCAAASAAAASSFASAPATDRLRLQACLTAPHRTGSLRVARRIVDPRLAKRIPPLAALAAAAAVQPVDRLHARQRQLERHAERCVPSRSRRPCACAANGASIAMRPPSPSDSARDIVAKNSGVASGNGLPASGPM